MSDLQHLPCYHFDVAELERSLGDLVVGLEATQLTELNARLEANFPMAGYIYDKSRAIRTGVDTAMWDLAGKSVGLPVCDLLGGRVRDGLPIAYPIFRRQRPADVQTGLDIVAERVAQGFRTFRVYVGRDLELDHQFLREVHARWGEQIRLKSLDFSNLCDWKTAVRFVDRVADLPIEIVEAPAPNHDAAGLAKVRDRIPHKVSEHVYSYRWALQLIETGAVDVFNISVIAIGGITPARKLFAIADAAEIPCIIGTTQELSIGSAAAAHLGMAMAAATEPADPIGPLLYTTDVVAEEVEYRDGELRVPAGPGLGMRLDPARLAAAAGPLSWAHTTVRQSVDRAPNR